MDGFETSWKRINISLIRKQKIINNFEIVAMIIERIRAPEIVQRWNYRVSSCFLFLNWKFDAGIRWARYRIIISFITLFFLPLFLRGVLSCGKFLQFHAREKERKKEREGLHRLDFWAALVWSFLRSIPVTFTSILPTLYNSHVTFALDTAGGIARSRGEGGRGEWFIRGKENGR